MLSVEMKRRNLHLRQAVGLALLLSAFFFYIYQIRPFSDFVTDVITINLTNLAAVCAAVIATSVWRTYGRSSPGAVWNFFALAVWGWAIGEIIFSYQYFSGGAYLVGPADIFWASSYVFFGLALYRQYGLIYRPGKLRATLMIAFTSVLVILATYLFAVWLARRFARPVDAEVLVNAYYVVSDFCLVGASLWLAFAFRNGALAHPWLGLVAFAFSDLFYTLLVLSGGYSRSAAQGSIVISITDTSYFSAYLILALGFYLHRLLLQYGPPVKK